MNGAFLLTSVYLNKPVSELGRRNIFFVKHKRLSLFAFCLKCSKRASMQHIEFWNHLEKLSLICFHNFHCKQCLLKLKMIKLSPKINVKNIKNRVELRALFILVTRSDITEVNK